MRIYLFINIMVISSWLMVDKGYSQCCIPTTNNLVIGGGFEEGCNDSHPFTTAMTLQCTGAGWSIDSHHNGVYNIGNGSVQSSWTASPRTGNHYFVGDGLWGDANSPTANTAWCQYIPVIAGKTYLFKIYYYNEQSGNAPIGIGFDNAAPVATSDENVVGVWQPLCAEYTATTTGLVLACVYKYNNKTNYYSGNDFGLDDIEFRELPPFEIADKPDVTICWGQSVTLSAEVLVGSGNYTYTWNSGQTTSSIVVSPTETAYYNVIVRDLVSGCRRTDRIKVNVIKLNLNLGQDLKICLTSPTIVKALANGGSGNYSYNWSNGATTQSISLNHTQAGTYQALVTDNVYGCTVQDEITSVAWQCPGTQYYQNTNSLPTLSYYNQIIAGSAVTGGTQGPVIVQNGQNVTFKGGQSVELYPGFSTNSGAVFLGYIEPGCSFGQLVINKINFPNCTYLLSASPLFGSGNYSYSWNTGASTRDIMVSPGSTTTYTVNVTDNCLGNSGTASYTIEPHYIGTINAFVPNSFTPNGDGYNDTWVVTDNGKQQYAFDANYFFLFIENRWGDIVWTLSGNVNLGADQPGFAEGDIYWPGNNLSDGTYWAYLMLENCNYQKEYKTWIHRKTTSGLRVGMTEEIADTSAFYTMENTMELNKIRVSPNPSKGEFRVEVPGDNGYYLYVEDVYGKIIYEKWQERNVSEVVLKDLKAGLYYIKTKVDGLVYSSKIIISD